MQFKRNIVGTYWLSNSGSGYLEELLTPVTLHLQAVTLSPALRANWPIRDVAWWYNPSADQSHPCMVSLLILPQSSYKPLHSWQTGYCLQGFVFGLIITKPRPLSPRVADWHSRILHQLKYHLSESLTMENCSLGFMILRNVYVVVSLICFIYLFILTSCIFRHFKPKTHPDVAGLHLKPL